MSSLYEWRVLSVMYEFYKELGYIPGWKFGIATFSMIIPLLILIGIGCILSLPILVIRKCRCIKTE